MKIGIFGGAFNPVHNGHLHLLEVLKRAPQPPDFTVLDKIILIPTANPPHRDASDFADGQDRINMLNLAIGQNDMFRPDIDYNVEVSDIEFALEGKNYTYNTLKALKQLYPYDDLFLFMGSDQLLNFKNWYKYKKILRFATVIGFSRSKEDNEKIKQYLIDNPEFNGKMHAMVAAPFEVSSTQIRDMIKSGESVKGLLPDAVEDYIKEHRLYV